MNRRPVGFTIVELLIVIVVIAILAAITIVAFNGIQERARVSKASTELSQIAKKIRLWQVDNPDQLPTTLNAVGVENSGNTSYQFRRYDNNTSYCASVTFDGDKSYFSSSTNPSTVTSGSCTNVATVAGAPLALNSTPGSSSSFPAVTGTPDIILYAVFQVNNLNDAWFNIASMQPGDSTKTMQLDTADAGSNMVRYRVDTSTTANASASQPARTVGKHIGWVQVRNNLTVREFAYDQASVAATHSMTPGAGWNFNQVRLGTTTASTVPIATVAYNATHDQATRARVMQWLADSYSVPMTF